MANYVVAATKDQVHSQVLWSWEIDVAAGDVLDAATSGDLCIVVCASGEGFVGIAANDWDDNRSKLVIEWGAIYRITVSAITAANADAAIECGDSLWFNATDSRFDLDRTDTGIYVVKAMETLASGTSDEIAVLIDQAPADQALAT